MVDQPRPTIHASLEQEVPLEEIVGRPPPGRPLPDRPLPGRPLRGPSRPRTFSELSNFELPELLAATGGIHLFQRHLDVENRPVRYDIQLSTLQRMVILYLQRKLADIVYAIYTSRRATDIAMEEAKKLLADYCKGPSQRREEEKRSKMPSAVTI
jgi:hypothetical protein